jgi:hypothetical protein
MGTGHCPAVVKSKDGEPKGGLTKDDFGLKQDGNEEPIHYFSQGSELPLTFALMVDTSGSQRTFIGDESLASDVFFETTTCQRSDFWRSYRLKGARMKTIHKGRYQRGAQLSKPTSRRCLPIWASV